MTEANELVYPEEPQWADRLARMPYRRRAALVTRCRSR